MFENMASFVASEHLGAATFEPPLGPAGDERLLSPYYRPLPTKDGFITAHPNDNRQAFAFFAAIGKPELRDDPRFNTPKARSENAAAFFELRAEALREKTTAEWLDILAAADVPAARYNRIEDLLEDPHLSEVGFWEQDDHPTEGRIRRTRIPNRFSGGMREKTTPAPRLGRDTVAILRELGHDEESIAKMMETGAAFGEGA